MNAEKTSYTEVLADLEAKREEIDRAIAVIRKVLLNGAADQAPTSAAGTAAPESSSPVLSPDEIPRNAFSGLSLPDAIRQYLRLVNRKQTPTQICRGIQRGGFHSVAKNLNSNVYTSLMRLEEQGEAVKIGREWALTAWFPRLQKEKGAKRKPLEESSRKEIAPKASPAAASGSSNNAAGDGSPWTMRERIKHVLKKAGKPLTIDEVAQALREINFAFNLKSLKTSLGAMANENRGLYRHGVGQYGLTEWQGEPAA